MRFLAPLLGGLVSLLASLGLFPRERNVLRTEDPGRAGRVLAETYSNPVSHDHTADPDVTRVGDRYLVASTSNRPEDFARGGFELKTSPATGAGALVEWTRAGNVFPLGAWPAWVKADFPDFWAPAWGRPGVAELFGVARHRDGDLAIFYAHAKDHLGPYEAPAPLIRGPVINGRRVGVIDPHFFEWNDHGKKRQILYYKLDGNDASPPVPTDVYAWEIGGWTAEGPTFLGSPVTVMTNDAGEHVIEAPFVVQHGDDFVMIASKDCYADPSYSLVAVRSRSPFDFSGPKKEILTSGEKFKAPGHHTLVEHEGKTMLLFHAFDAGAVGWDQARKLHMMELRWGADGLPLLGDGKPPERPLVRPGIERGTSRPFSEGILRAIDRARDHAAGEDVR